MNTVAVHNDRFYNEVMDINTSNSPTLKRVAEAINKQRKNAGLSQAKLASELSVSQPLVSHWEHGKLYPAIDHIAKMEKLFGLEPGALFISMAY